jgi:galactose oxidase-like protein/flagellar hook capping protein FlgD
MVIFGGQSASGPLNDVWAFDLDTHGWTNLTPASGAAPAPRFTPASVYDAVGHRMLTWSGQGTGEVFFNDVWSFDLTIHAWSQQGPTGGPPNVRYGVASVFDPVARDLVTFAGFTNLGRFHDVWRFDAAAVTWTDVSPMTGPIERCLHTASYDSKNHRMIMYGGQNAGPLGDIWALDLTSNAWTDLTPATRPGGRFFTSSVYDSANHRSTIFGGTTSGGKTAEVWVFDLTTNTWQQLSPGGTAPSARDGSAAVYDGTLDRMVFFGGEDTSRRNDVWALRNLSSTVGIPDGTPSRSVTLRPGAPNPFHSSTAIHFDSNHSGHVALRIYDVRGRLVRMLLSGFRPAGSNAVSWDGRDDTGKRVSAGVYLCQLDHDGGSATRKLVLAK